MYIYLGIAKIYHNNNTQYHEIYLLSAHNKRRQMDRRRFEAAHLKYASLKMVSWYPDTTSYNCVKFEGDVTDTLNEITPPLFSSFEANYAG